MKAFVVAFALLGAVFTALPSSAEEDARWAYRLIRRQHCDEFGYCRHWYVRVRTYQPPVYSYEGRHFDLVRDRRSWDCKETRRAVGDQHLTVDGAKKAANDAWAGAVRFHLGEKFMDLDNARRVSYECSRSSIKEGGVTTLGQTLTRCEIEAQPCKPLREFETREGRR